MKRAWMLVRREFWEHRGFLIAPAMVSALLILAAALGGNIDFTDLSLQDVSRASISSKRDLILGGFLTVLTSPFVALLHIVATLYLLECLHADRKDRSVLFWKSLPVSDAATVVSKLVVAVLVLPLLVFAIALATDVAFVLIGTLRLAGPRPGPLWALLWAPQPWLDAHEALLYALATSTLWYLPMSAWLLLVSAWARRGVMLWAVAPPLLGILGEAVLLRTSHFARLCWDRLNGWVALSFDLERIRAIPGLLADEGSQWAGPASVTELLTPRGFASSPQLWYGCAVALAMVLAAVALRRRNNEI